jgi:hypothetical protein
MSYLTFYGGQAWVRAAAPASNPDPADLIPNISEMTISISPETSKKGPYLSNGDNSQYEQVTSVSREASFTLDLPQAASATIDLLRSRANSGERVWFRYREGLAADGGSTTYTFPSAIITSFESAGGADGITVSVTLSGTLTIETS